jgi:hypothetical protein
MSALCQKQTLRQTWFATLFDHLIGAEQHRLRHAQAERLYRLEVDRKLELCRLLHREFDRGCAAENAINVIRCAMEHIVPVCTEIRRLGENVQARGSSKIICAETFAPGAIRAGRLQRNCRFSGQTVRAGAGESAPSAHDIVRSTT